MALTDDRYEMTSSEMHLEIKRLRGLLEECKPFVKRIADSEPMCGNDECGCHDSVRLLRKIEAYHG